MSLAVLPDLPKVPALMISASAPVSVPPKLLALMLRAALPEAMKVAPAMLSSVPEPVALTGR